MDTKILSPREVVNLNLAEMRGVYSAPEAPPSISKFWTAIVLGPALLVIVVLLSSILPIMF